MRSGIVLGQQHSERHRVARKQRSPSGERRDNSGEHIDLYKHSAVTTRYLGKFCGQNMFL